MPYIKRLTNLARPRKLPIIKELEARNPKTNPPNKEKPMAAAANKIVCQAAPSAFTNSGVVSKGTSDS